MHATFNQPSPNDVSEVWVDPPNSVSQYGTLSLTTNLIALHVPVYSMLFYDLSRIDDPELKHKIIRLLVISAKRFEVSYQNCCLYYPSPSLHQITVPLSHLTGRLASN